MENQEYQVRDLLILEDDRKKEIKIGSDKFVIKAAFPRDQKEIARMVALEYDGLPVSSFSVDDRYLFNRDATLDTLIDEAPQWWRKAELCLDENVKNTLYEEILEWSKAFQEKLKKNKFKKRGAEKS